jgi:hypothetical protein
MPARVVSQSVSPSMSTLSCKDVTSEFPVRRSNCYACSLDPTARKLVCKLSSVNSRAGYRDGWLERLSPDTADLGLEGPVGGGYRGSTWRGKWQGGILCFTT